MSALTSSEGYVRKVGPIDRLAGWVTLIEGWRRVLLTVFAGAICIFALPPYNFPLVGFIGFPLLVWLLDGAVADPTRSLIGRLRPSFATGWLFGFGYFVAGLWWLGAAMMVDAAEFAVFIPFAVLVLPAICGVYFGLATLLARLVWSDSAWRIFALAASLALFEFLRATLFTGFPWNEIGVMAAPLPLMMQTASLFGVHGLTLIAVIVFSSPAVLLDRAGRGPVLAIVAALLVFHLGFGAWRMLAHPTVFVAGVNVRVVQPNIAQTEKWDEDEANDIFKRHIDLTAMRAAPGDIVGRTPPTSAPAHAPATGTASDGSPLASPAPPATQTLVIWPETSFPFILTHRPDAIQTIADTLEPGETLIAGAARVEGVDEADARYYNSVYVIDDQGQIITARDKTHLVPFGEYLPYQNILEKIGLRQIARAMPGGFSPGTSREKVELEGVPSFLPLICYEIIFPGEIDVGTPATRPGFLVNDTNDAWYGDTPGPYQHLRLAELSSVAFGLPLVRSANTGISVVLDAYGRQIGGLALDSTGTIETGLPQAAANTLFARLGNLPFWVCFMLLSVAAIGARVRLRARIG